MSAREIDEVIRQRRTNLAVDPDDPVDPDVLAEMCRLATWAPNHKRTNPWRFAIVTGDDRRTLGDLVAMSVADDRPERVATTRIKYLRSAAVILVGSAAHPDPTLDGENRDAVAAGIQNMLLSATARGLASFWASVPDPTFGPLIDWCGWHEGARIVGLVYVGHPVRSVSAPPRDEPVVTWRTAGPE